MAMKLTNSITVKCIFVKTIRPKIVGFSEPDDVVRRKLVPHFRSDCFHKKYVHFTAMLLVNFITIFYYLIMAKTTIECINNPLTLS